MKTWYVHRRGDGAIASVHEERQPGYATEALPDDDQELAAYHRAVQNPVPKRAKSGNFVRALYELEHLEAVEAAIAAALAQGNRLPDLLFRHASEFERDHPLVAQIAAAAELSNAEVDAVFRCAASYD